MRVDRSCAIATAACAVLAAASAHASEALRAGGTGAALGTMQRLAAGYQTAAGVEIRLLPSLGSSGGIKAVAEGAIDLGLSGRDLRPEERSRGLVALPFARTLLVFAAGPRAGVASMTHGEAARIYRGETVAWPSGERVRVVLRPRADVDTALVRAISAEMAAAVDAALDRPGMLMAVTNQECDEMLVRIPGAFGPSSLAEILTLERAPAALAWNGVTPTVEHLIDGSYPLVKDLFLVVRAPAAAPVRRFAAFLASPEARRILQESGNLPLPLPALE